MTKSPRTPYSLSFSSPSYLSGNLLFSYSHTTKSILDFMSTEQHEQPTELTDPNGTELTNNNSTKINYTIRLVLADSNDSDKENNRPNIRQLDTTKLLEHQNERSSGNAHRRSNNDQGDDDSSHLGHQILPTDVNSTSSRSTSPDDKPNQDDGEIRGSETTHRLLHKIPIIRETTGHRSFDHLRTTKEVNERLTQYARSTSTLITTDDNKRLSTLWILLKDICLVSALIRQARIKFNYLCANLIKIFVNISRIEWSQSTPPGGSIKQLGFDLLQRILAADVE